MIGRCRVLSRIATGGMAIVYKVMHEELEVVRAVKILKPDSSQEWRDRLRTEAKISAHLHHPNIVQIYNVDVWRDELPYIEMEYVDGPSLEGLIATHGRLPVPFAVALTTVVCTALYFAQNRGFRLYGKVYSGLVHRDIKPANILMTSSGIVKLADFGIAQPGNVSLHTVGSHVLGTYAYLSPEQLGGNRLDQRSDLYSLALVLYEMVTGHKAFPQKVIGELVQSKLQGAIRPAASLAPDLPDQLAVILARALALKKEDRFGSANEMAQALGDLLATMTRRRPEEVVCEVMGEESESLTMGVAEIPSPNRTWGWLAASVLGAAAIAAMVLLSRIGPTGSRRHTPRLTHSPAATSMPVDSIPDAENNSAKPDASEPPSPRRDDAASRQTPRTPAVSPSPPRPEKDRPPLPVETTATKQAASGKPDSDSLRLSRAAAYLERGDTPEAIALLSEPIHDGLYFLLLGRCHLAAGRYAKAEEALGMAQTTPSAVAGDTRRDAVYWWAVNRNRLYTHKPNLENRSRALKAWRSYRDAFCRPGEEHASCHEADEAIARLERKRVAR
jgi:serine/threonine-protein kinase